MKTIKSTSLLVAAAVAAGGMALAGSRLAAGNTIAASENFENTTAYPLGSSLAGDNGGAWTDLSGGSNYGFKIITATGTGDATGQALGSPDNTRAQESFGNPGYTNAEDVYYSAWMNVADGNQALNFAVQHGSTVGSETGPQFGIGDTGTGTPGQYVHPFTLQAASFGTGYRSTTDVIPGDWYELRLQVFAATNPNNDTGTLYYRDISAGQITYTAVSGITNVSLNFDSSVSRDPAGFDTWWVSGWQYSGNSPQIDNLQTGIGDVPEPATLGLLALGGLGLLLLPKRRKTA